MASTPDSSSDQRPRGSVELSGSLEPRGADDLAELLETLPDAVYRVDRDGFVVYANQEAQRLLGYAMDELRRLRHEELVRADFREHVARFFRHQTAEQRGSSYLEYPMVASDGREIWIGQTTRLVEKDGEIVGSQAVARYLGDRSREEEHRRGLALRDSETGLLSPMGFRLVVEQQAARAARIGTAFTLVVLALGPPSGRATAEDDEDRNGALARLSRTLRAEVRASDSLCRSAHLQVSLLLPDTGRSDAEAMLDRIGARLASAVAPWSLHPRFQAWDPDDPVSAEELLTAAGAATPE